MPRLVFGTVAVYAGAIILLVAGMEEIGGGFLDLPRFWYVNRTIWIGLALLMIPAGIAIQGWHVEREKRWRATRMGQRFEQVIVYSKEGCHLCDEAVELLWDFKYSQYLPLVKIVDISGNPDLEARFGQTIPVVEFDGRIRFKGRINEILLRRLIEGTPPLDMENQASHVEQDDDRSHFDE